MFIVEIDGQAFPSLHNKMRDRFIRIVRRLRKREHTLDSVEASVLASDVAWWKEALLGAKATAEPAERKRTAVESFMVSITIDLSGHFFMNSMHPVAQNNEKDVRDRRQSPTTCVNRAAERAT